MNTSIPVHNISLSLVSFVRVDFDQKEEFSFVDDALLFTLFGILLLVVFFIGFYCPIFNFKMMERAFTSQRHSIYSNCSGNMLLSNNIENLSNNTTLADRSVARVVFSSPQFMRKNTKASTQI